MTISKLITTSLVSLTCFNIIFSNIVAFSQSMLPVGSFFVSEINWDGSWQKDQVSNTVKSNSEDEWVEFYNPSSASVNLADYNIKGFSSSNKDLSYAEPLKCSISPNSYLIVARLAASPTLPASSACVATNLSISNTNTNYTITDKNNLLVDSFNIGDPSKITTNKSVTQKFSIYRQGPSWLESGTTINLTQTLDPTLEYTHNASPYGDNLTIQNDISKTITTKNLPYELSFTTNLKQTQAKWSLTQTAINVYQSECKSQNTQYLVTALPAFQVYCARLTYTLEAQDQTLFGYADYSFELKPEIEPAPVPSPNVVVQITELDLNQDQFELYNPSATQIDLSNIFLQDTLGAVKKSKMTGWVIGPQSYGVFNTKTIGITLNNDGDNLLLTDQNGTQISRSAIAAQAKNQAKNQSWQYFQDSNSWEEHLSTLGRENQRTKTVEQLEEPETIKETKRVPPKNPKVEAAISQNLAYFENKLKINEIYPEAAEFIELYNFSDTELELGGLKIRDLQGKITTFSLAPGTKIGAKNYLQIDLKGKINLNNSGDGVELLTSENDTIDTVAYQKSQGLDQSYQLLGDDWFWSKITPGTVNLKSDLGDDETDNDDSNLKINPKSKPKSSSKAKQPQDSQSSADKKTAKTVEICTEVNIYIQTSKNIFYSNLGKISIPNTTTTKLPSKMLVCNLKTSPSSRSAKFKNWTTPLKYSNFETLDDQNNPKNRQFVQFKLACKGKKTIDIIRSDISLKTILGGLKPNCVDKSVAGFGFVEKTTKNYNLFYIGPAKANTEVTKDLVRTAEQESKPEISNLFENLKKWWYILTLQRLAN